MFLGSGQPTGAGVFTLTGVQVVRLGLLVHLVGVGGLAFVPAM